MIVVTTAVIITIITSSSSSFTSCLYCVIAFHFTISMYMLRTFHPMFHCICMHVDVWFASVRPK